MSETRNWRDINGKVTEKAKFERIYDGNVVLSRSGGRGPRIPFASLSREDQQYIRGLLTARGEGHTCPPASDDNPASTVGGFLVLGLKLVGSDEVVGEHDVVEGLLIHEVKEVAVHVGELHGPAR